MVGNSRFYFLFIAMLALISGIGAYTRHLPRKAFSIQHIQQSISRLHEGPVWSSTEGDEGQGDVKEPQKVYLNVPFAEKAEAKQMGARWDTTCKSWYAYADDLRLLERWPVNLDPNKRLLNMKSNEVTKKVFLQVPFEEKDEAKALGAKYDMETKKWYAPNAEASLLSRWGPSASHTTGTTKTTTTTTSEQSSESSLPPPEQQQQQQQQQGLRAHSNVTTTYYLTVPFEDKDEAKAMGAKWDKEGRSWYVTDPSSPALSRWPYKA
eukprot:gene3086-3374_t